MYTRRQVQEYSLQHYSTSPPAAAAKQLKCPPAEGWINTATTPMHGHYIKQKKPDIYIKKMNTLWFCLRSFRIGKLIILGLTIIGVTYGGLLTGKWHPDSFRVRILYLHLDGNYTGKHLLNLHSNFAYFVVCKLYLKNIWSKNKMLTCVHSQWWLHRVLWPNPLYFSIY